MTLGHMILSHTLSLCSKSRKEKKRNINNDLVVLPSHDNLELSTNSVLVGVEVSPLCFLLIMVCAAADSIVY